MKKNIIGLVLILLFTANISQASIKEEVTKSKALELYLYSGTELALYYKPDEQTESGDSDEKLFSPLFYVGMNIKFVLFEDYVNPILDIKFGQSAIRNNDATVSEESFQNLDSATSVGFDFGVRLKFYQAKYMHYYGAGYYGGLIPTVDRAKDGFYNSFSLVVGAEVKLNKLIGSYMEVGLARNDMLDNYIRAHIKTHVKLSEFVFIGITIDNDLGPEADDFKFIMGFQSKVMRF